MVYLPSVPQVTDFIAQSQQDFLGNFQTASDIWGKLPQENDNVGDHVPLTNPEDDERGGHKKVTFLEQDTPPTAAANEAVAYSEEQNSVTEMFYVRNGDAAGFQLTSAGGLSQGGLILRAFVVFDFQGKIIEVERVDSEDEVIKVQQQFNVTSVDPNQPLLNGRNVRADWNVIYTNPIPTADYIWICDHFGTGAIDSRTQASPINFQPRNNAAYGSTVTTTSIGLRGYGMADSTLGVNFNLARMCFQVYTVALL